MISLKYNFLFIHIPKTGGNSIQNVLYPYSDDKIVKLNELQDGKERFEIRNHFLKIEKHSSLKDYKNQLDINTYKKIWKFSVIRNPFERAISFYFSPHLNYKIWDRNKFIELLPKIKPMRNYIRTNNNLINYIIKPPLNSELDYLLRYENLNEDFKKVCHLLNIKQQELPHRNKSNKGDYRKYYDAKLEKMVYNYFKDEVEYGNYKL